jgi:hypothetical protein
MSESDTDVDALSRTSKSSEPPTSSELSDIEVASSAAAVIRILDPNTNGKTEKNAISLLEDSLHIKKISNYLPIIVLVVILLITFVSSELLIGNWPIFVSLILTFLYVLYIHYLSPNSFLVLREELNATIFPSPPADEDFNINSWSEKIIRIVIPLSLFILGLGMGFGSISASASDKVSNLDLTRSMIGFGSILIIGALIFGLYKKFSEKEPLREWIHYIVISFLIGVPMIVRGNEIQKNMDNVKDDPLSTKENKETFAKSSADLILGFGLFFQIAVFLAFGYLIWRNVKPEDKGGLDKVSKISGIITFIILLGIPASIFLAASQKSEGLVGAKDLTEYGQKVFLVHGIVWFIALVGLVVTLFGDTLQFTIHKFLIPIALVILVIVGYISFPITFAATNLKEPSVEDIFNKENKSDNEFAKSGYYQQLRQEVMKDLAKKDPNIEIDETAINEAIQTRVDEDKKKTFTPINAMLSVVSILSVIIAVFILMCYNVRLKLADCGNIPDSFKYWWKDALKYTTNPDCTGVENTLNTLKAKDMIQKKIKEDNMTSDDWDKILIKYPDKSSLYIRFAKWFSMIPFWSVILLVMWVSVLFTNVTTSPKTSDWISNKFTGDMFPRVKELIDAFFIVIIVGLLLCAILLLPIVKEMNVGGLDSILKFAQSVQVWQFNMNNSKTNQGNITGLIFFLAVFFIGLSWWWRYLDVDKPSQESKIGRDLPVVPENWGWAIAFVILLALCLIPTGYHMWAGFHVDFKNEFIVKRILRLILTTIYLIPWLIIILFRAGIYSIASFTGIQEFIIKRDKEFNKLKFWDWSADDIDLRMFPTDDNPLKPASVTSVPSKSKDESIGDESGGIGDESGGIGRAAEPSGINETKVGAIGKLIKVLLLTISFVILILAVIYYVYKIDAEFVNKGAESDAVASGGIMANLNSPTAHTIYVLIAIVAVAGIVAYIREKFKQSNNDKTPEKYLFDDMKTEDEQKPLRQLAFGATHIVYVILMVIVWIYDREKDEKERMSVTGMTVLGLAILFFHYGLEFIDTLNPAKMVGGTETKPSITDLFSNVRFIINTVFFIVLCTLAYYKQHGVMVVLILFMFIFHLTKSYIGLKILKLIWLGIIFIPCLFLDMLTSSQSVVGDTTRTIWIIVAIEILLIAILYGGPYLLNYIGASASQIVAAPVSLKQKYDTKLNTQSPQIFIYHNTGIDRTPEDKAANCPVEEKIRYNYSISGWFFLNNTTVSSNIDLEIFDFGGVPKMTYNNKTTELKLWCNTLDMSGSPLSTSTMIYNSKTNYNTIIAGKNENKKNQIRMLIDNEEELDVSIPLQKWNYFVVNYNGKTMDLFMNNRLLIRSDFIMPDIVLKPITIGDKSNNKGLNGSICNFAFHKVPLTKEQIRWTYTMLKSQNPPMIGMKTIEDEVKEAGTTTVYSK